MKYIFFGLGNFGDEYEKTRHNTGFLMMDYLAKYFEAEDFVENKKMKVLEAKADFGKHKITLLKPMNFMNTNGKVLPPFVKSKKDAERLAVIYDELDLPLGKMKMAYGRSSGGHKGLESVIKSIKTKDFLRVRVGVSGEGKGGRAKKPVGEEKVIKFILGKFKEDELSVLKKESKKVFEALQTWISHSREKAMNEFN